MKLLTIMLIFSACGQKVGNELIIKGEISNIESTVIEIGSASRGSVLNKVELKGGKFTYKMVLKEPTVLMVKNPGKSRYDKRNCINFYVSAGDVKVKLNGDDFSKSPVIEGSPIYLQSEKFAAEVKRRFPTEAPDYTKELTAIYSKTDAESEKRKAEIYAEQREWNAQKYEVEKEVENWYIDTYPDDYYSVVLVVKRNSGKRGGKTLKQVKAEVARLSQKMQATPVIKELVAKSTTVAKTDKGFDEIMKDASNVTYKCDKSFKASQFKGIKYLASFSNGNLCAINANGTVSIISPQGKLIRKIEIEAEEIETSVAVGPDDKIYIPTQVSGKQRTRIRGRMVENTFIKKVECYVYDYMGKQLDKFELAGMKYVFGLKVHDGYIAASDIAQRLIKLYDLNTKQEVCTIKNLRPCCMMLDFDLNHKNQVVVANLAAFRTQIYDFKGNLQATFGKRGKTLNDFHGCCNPVSVASLKSGALVTVEKDPTRIKIFSKEGAKKIEGIDELVKGCTYIPMTVDRNENIYLASPEKGLVRCIVAN